MTNSIIIEANTECLHCLLHACIKAFWTVNPKEERNDILNAVCQVAGELLVICSKTPEEAAEATEAFVSHIASVTFDAQCPIPPSGKLQ